MSELYNYLDTIEISKEELEQFIKMIIQCNNFRSRGTLEHSITVEVITYNLYKLLGIVREDMDTILLSAFCHDLGKLFTPIEILEKSDKLTYEEMEIMNIVTDITKRNQGFASSLLSYIIKYAVKNNIEKINLEVNTNNKVAKNLYKSFGFVEVGKRPKYYKGDDAILMTNTL